MRQMEAGIQKMGWLHPESQGQVRYWVEVRGYIYATTYADGYFGDLNDSDILAIVRKHYRENPKDFRRYDLSTGHFIK